MNAPWRTAHCTASCLVWLLVWCSVVVVQVHALPCETQGNVQLPMIVCFITASNEHYDYESLRTGLCSHIVLIDLIGVGKDGSLELLQTSSRSLDRFTKLRQHFSDVGDEARFIISIGGIAQKSCHFSNALKTAESRFALSDELISFVIKHKLGGLDIAWFYPAQFGGAESDRTTLIVFLRDLYLRTKACDISLSLTVGVDPKDIEISYDVPRINEVVDFVNLLTGDYHNPTSPTHISPLYGQGPRDRLNINYSVTSYIEAGLNPRKIIIMGSCYAYLYTSKICKNDTFTSTKLRTVMRLSYLSANELITRESFRTSWDDMRHVPYGILTKGITKKWLTYNDVESIRRKADYAQHRQLGGMGLFSVDEDDYGGRAGFGRYPMLRAVVSVLYPQLDCSEEEAEELIETIVCPYTGYMTDPVEPECYYTCEEGTPLYECPKKCCPQGQTFNEDRNTCYQSTGMTQAPFNSNLIHRPIEQPFVYQPPYQYQPPTGYQVPGDQYMDNTRYQQPTEHLRIASNNVPKLMPDMPQLTVQNYDSVAQVNVPMPGQDRIPIIEVSSTNTNPGQQYSFDVTHTLLGSPSTMAPMYASADEPEHQASNLVPQVVVIPNADEGHIPQGSTATTTEAVEILNTPCALKSELEEQATDPPVVITPKPSRSSRREKDRRRKSRSKSHTSKATSTEMPETETTSITTPECTTVTESSSVDTVTATTTTTTTTKRYKKRKITTDTTQPPPTKETTEPVMVSSSSDSSTSSVATTTSSTTTPSTMTVTTTTSSTTVSTTATTPNVTFSDKTTAPSTTTTSPVPTALSNTRIATATATTASTVIADTTLHDAPLPLETTIT